MIFRNSGTQRAHLHLWDSAHRHLAKCIASARGFTYDVGPAPKDPYDRTILQFFWSA
jgi:hypothetical protein